MMFVFSIFFCAQKSLPHLVLIVPFLLVCIAQHAFVALPTPPHGLDHYHVDEELQT